MFSEEVIKRTTLRFVLELSLQIKEYVVYSNLASRLLYTQENGISLKSFVKKSNRLIS